MNVLKNKRRSLRLKTKCVPHIPNVNVADPILFISSEPKVANKINNHEVQTTNNSPNKKHLLNEKRKSNYLCVTDKDENFYSDFENNSSEYLFEFFHENNESEELSHKFYSCRKNRSSQSYGESFGLPDDPIFSNGSGFLEQKKRSPLDTNTANPQDICVLDLKLINKPWLVEYPEVITPYWDIESLFPFDDVRIKIDPENIDFPPEERASSENFNFSREIFENMSDSNCMFTSTPVKKHNYNTSLVSAINISNNNEEGVNISHLKDQVVKALQEAIKESQELGNVDMKIKVLKASNNKNNKRYKLEKEGFEINKNGMNNINMDDDLKKNKLSEKNKKLENMPIVRRNLRSNLGFSREDKFMNVTNAGNMKNFSIKSKKNIKENENKTANIGETSQYLESPKVLRSGLQINKYPAVEQRNFKSPTTERSLDIQCAPVDNSKIMNKSIFSNQPDLELPLDVDELLKDGVNNKQQKNKGKKSQGNKIGNLSLDENELPSRELRSQTLKLKTNLDILQVYSLDSNLSQSQPIMRNYKETVKSNYEESAKLKDLDPIINQEYLDSLPLAIRLEKEGDLQDQLELVSVKTEDCGYNDEIDHPKVDLGSLIIKSEVEDNLENLAVKNASKNAELTSSDLKTESVGQNSLNGDNVSVVKRRGRPKKISNFKTDVISTEDIKQEYLSYELGVFVWAQLAKYPYWPAFICHDPESNQYYNSANKQNKSSITYYHIRFFGDNGRRAWIHKNHLMLYCSKEDLELIANKLKSERKSYNTVKHYLVTGGPVVVEKWNKAVEELESVKGQTYEEIHTYLLNCWDQFQELKKQKKTEKRRSGLGVSISGSEPLRGSKRKRTDSQSSISADVDSKKTKKYATPFVIDGENRKLQEQEIVYITRTRRSATQNHFNEKDVKSLVKGKHEPVKGIEEDKKETIGIEEAHPSNFSTINGNRTKVNRLQENDEILCERFMNEKQFEERSDTESKISSHTSSSKPEIYSFEYHTELHRKNNLFNGLRNIKVCDYCLKQGDIFKCKGKCGNYYHVECASKISHPKVIKPKAKKTDGIIKNVNKATSGGIKGDDYEMRDEQVQIVTVKSKRSIGTPSKNDLPSEYHKMSLAEQIDYKMKEMMSTFESGQIYQGESTDSSSEEGSLITTPKRGNGVSNSLNAFNCKQENEEKFDMPEISEKSTKQIWHITADTMIIKEEELPLDVGNLKCTYCRFNKIPACFACGLEVSERDMAIRKKCSYYRCAKYFHLHCLKAWPQTQWSIGKWSKNHDAEDTFSCPSHMCHTCFSEELGFTSRSTVEKLAKCVLCPAAYHATNFCIPAGSEILGGTQIICPRHGNKTKQPINTCWCFICSEGGNLICCDTCPTSIHPECQPITLTDDDKYICEDCESGRFPLYDEVVWVKLGQYKWWPALVLFPNEIPDNVRAIKHQARDFAVRFFGTNDHYWVNKARSFLFQEGDSEGIRTEVNKSKNPVYKTFKKAVEDAAIVFKFKKEFKLRREAESINSLKPPPFIKINKNRPVGNVKTLELNISSVNACECDPDKAHPCGPDSDCINRLLMTECDPDVCSAGIRCRNQAFQKREYMPVVPYKTQGRGWGLKCLTPIKKGQFIIEYVGELIDSEEYQRRIRKMHAQKDENYYFMTIDGDRVIDAGPKGNYSRFMNHCCDPNCVTQKWTIKGETRVGLFANCDINSGVELTFNYNLEVVGQEKKVCKCGASNCSGFIGVKVKNERSDKASSDTVTETRHSATRSRKSLKKKLVLQQPVIPVCFVCNEKDSDVICNNKACNKGYHLKCLNISTMPEAPKFTCPRHNCNICSNRTIRCCVKCTNSFCPSHADTNVRYDNFLGFVCRIHDPGLSVDKTEMKIEKCKKRWRFYKSKRREKMNFKFTRSNELKYRLKAKVATRKAKTRNIIKHLSISVKARMAQQNKKNEASSLDSASCKKKRSEAKNIVKRKRPRSMNIQPTEEKIEIKLLKSLKKPRRTDLDLADDSAVSSTTFDEDSIPKPPSRRSVKKDTLNDNMDQNRQDFVTSSPLKAPLVIDSDSDDELNIQERITRSKTVRTLRKRHTK